MLLFIHIPKTAGTSIVETMRHRHSIIEDYGRHHSKTDYRIQRYIYQRPNPQRLLRNLKRREVYAIVGHVQYRNYVDLCRPGETFTFLRDPVDRVVSAFHQRRRAFYNDRAAIDRQELQLLGWTDATPPKLESYITLPELQNIQSKFLSGVALEDLGFVGSTEHFEESIDRLNAWLGTALKVHFLNTNPDKPVGSYELEPGLRDYIEKTNHEDRDLYERACELFEARG